MHEKIYKNVSSAASGLVLCKLDLPLRTPLSPSAKSPPTLSSKKAFAFFPGPGNRNRRQKRLRRFLWPLPSLFSSGRFAFFKAAFRSPPRAAPSPRPSRFRRPISKSCRLPSLSPRRPASQSCRLPSLGPRRPLFPEAAAAESLREPAAICRNFTLQPSPRAPRRGPAAFAKSSPPVPCSLRQELPAGIKPISAKNTT